MNKIHEFPNQDKIHSEASEWLAKLDRGLTDGERVKLQQWLVDSRENRATLFNMAELWDKMDSLSRLSDLFPDVSRQRHVLPGVTAWRHRHFHYWLSAPWQSWGLPERSDRTRTASPLQVAAELTPCQITLGAFDDIYETSIGEHSSVNLPDGTQVILNTNSQVRVGYTDY